MRDVGCVYKVSIRSNGHTTSFSSVRIRFDSVTLSCRSHHAYCHAILPVSIEQEHRPMANGSLVQVPNSYVTLSPKSYHDWAKTERKPAKTPSDTLIRSLSPRLTLISMCVLTMLNLNLPHHTSNTSQRALGLWGFHAYASTSRPFRVIHRMLY